VDIDLFKTINDLGLDTPRCVVQVGASYGQELAGFIQNGISSAVLIEPLEAPAEHLKEICKPIPSFRVIRALCTDVPNQVYDFHIASNAGQSSSILRPSGHLNAFDFVSFQQPTRLVSTTVDIILDGISNDDEFDLKSVDLLYMDVQGAEYQVLLGATKLLKSCKFVYFEYIRNGLYEGTVSLPEYLSLLNAAGFELNNINFNKFHHSNALFVKRNILPNY
jgi:FkbM family methyltransferase